MFIVGIQDYTGKENDKTWFMTSLEPPYIDYDNTGHMGVGWKPILGYKKQSVGWVNWEIVTQKDIYNIRSNDKSKW